MDAGHTFIGMSRGLLTSESNRPNLGLTVQPMAPCSGSQELNDYIGKLWHATTKFPL